MSDMYLHIRIAHLLGIVFWVVGLAATIALVRVPGNGSAQSARLAAARGMALFMDIAAAAAIASGLWLALRSPRFPNTAFASGGWFHLKLTLVVFGPLLAHGLARARLGKLRRGGEATIPPWLLPVALGTVAVIIILAAHPTLLRK